MKVGPINSQVFLRTLIIFSVIISLMITSADSQSNDRVLAKVGNKEISVREYLERSELTIRSNNFKDKKTTLNNLVSEKILSLEAECNHTLLQSPNLQSTLKGIKEQSMREELYFREAFNKVKIDTQEIKTAYRLSMREYELEFFVIRNKELVQQIKGVIDSVPELTDDIFKQVGEILGEKPVHKINYKDPDDDVIHEALYSKLLDEGTVIGPLKLSNGNHIIMKVLNWIDYPLISGEDQQVRWKKVQEKMHQTKALKLWQSFQANVMKGKKLEFNKQSFKVLSNWAMAKYLDRKANDTLAFKISEIPSARPEIDMGDPFFTIDNRLWTVGDFRNELMSHPLVFRTTALDSTEF